MAVRKVGRLRKAVRKVKAYGLQNKRRSAQHLRAGKKAAASVKVGPGTTSRKVLGDTYRKVSGASKKFKAANPKWAKGVRRTRQVLAGGAAVGAGATIASRRKKRKKTTTRRRR